MRKIDGRITLLFSEDGLTIELHDDLSSTTFARVELDQMQTCQVLSRLSRTHCDMEVYELDRVGKKMEHKNFQFFVTKKKIYGSGRQDLAKIKIKEVCPEGWTPDLYFGSQGSFFYKDDEVWANATIRRWVDEDEEKN